MPGDPYRLDDRAILNVSGGRSSGYLLRRILDAHDGRLPAHVRAVFCNTGKERPETLAFLREMERRWDVPLTWLEFTYRAEARGGRRDPKYHYAEVDYETASREGEPFASLIRVMRMTPNIATRFCTKELKIKTVERWARRALGWPPRSYQTVLGIRYDERRRWGRILNTECRSVMPMVEAGETGDEVLTFWRQMDFDLGLPTNRSNCDLCFLKGNRLLVETLREDPSRADWWMAQEAWAAAETGDAGTFKQGMPFRRLLALAQGPDEQPALFADEPEIACHCTD